MRKDMKDVLLDTGRAWDGLEKKNYDWEDCGKEGIRKRHRHAGSFSQGDRLRPLTRFLRSRVGKPWNDVWSEICQQADHRSLRGIHLREHVQWMVAGSGGQEIAPDAWRYWQFYVDGDGILRQQEYEPYRYRKHEDPDKVEIDGIHYERVDGCWFQVEYIPINKRYFYKAWDGTQTYGVRTEYERKFIKTLSKKELKKLGLKK